MFRLLRLLAVISAGVGAGFVLAIFFLWTFALDIQSQRTSFTYRVNEDGSLSAIPAVVDGFSLQMHAEPYRPTAVVDLFDPKDSP